MKFIFLLTNDDIHSPQFNDDSPYGFLTLWRCEGGPYSIETILFKMLIFLWPRNCCMMLWQCWVMAVSHSSQSAMLSQEATGATTST
jgi:hypothetical protein